MNLSRANIRKRSAFSLIEVVTSTAIAGIVIGGSIYGYVSAAQRAEWAAYSLAANSLAMQRVEQTRAAKWDPLGFPPVDELIATNFPAQINMLDIPISKTNIVYATNFTTITTITDNPPLKMIRVACAWKFMNRGPFTNVVVTYRAPDQ